jgi:hypothetical protein
MLTLLIKSLGATSEEMRPIVVELQEQGLLMDGANRGQAQGG